MDFNYFYLSLHCLIVFVSTIFAVYLVKPLAIRIGLVDVPGERKIHRGQIPLVGGVAMLFGLFIGFLGCKFSLVEYRSLIAALGVLVFVGVLDDFHELSHRLRLFCQVLVSFIIVVLGKNTLHNLGDLLFLGDIHLGFLAIPLTMFAIVGVINAINMLDGADGVAGSVVLIAIVFLSILAFLSKRYNDFIVLSLGASAVLGFLFFNFPYNRNRMARIFMGDAGSMMLGVFLVWFLIRLSQNPNPVATPVTFLWIIALPLLDLVSVVCRRAFRYKSPFQGDRQHIHHVFDVIQYGTLTRVLILSFLSLGFGAIGFVANYLEVREGIMFLAYLSAAVLTFFVLHYFWCLTEHKQKRGIAQEL